MKNIKDNTSLKGTNGSSQILGPFKGGLPQYDQTKKEKNYE